MQGPSPQGHPSRRTAQGSSRQSVQSELIMTDVVRTNNLSKTYDNFTAVQDVTLSVARNEIYGFLGPNGAGKTTTIMMLLGLEKPTSGTISLFGDSLNEQPFEIKRRLGVVAESQHFYDDMTAREYLDFFAQLYRVEGAKTRIEELLEMVNLRDFGNARARDFSRGMQQKLGLVRALIHNPELLILDEPVSALDPKGVVEIRHLLLDQAKQGRTIFISSHILSEVEQTADRIGILNKGQLIVEDSLDAIRRHLQPHVEMKVELEKPSPALARHLEDLDFVYGASAEKNYLDVKIGTDQDYRASLSRYITHQGATIVGMAAKEMSLEEAFVTITEQNISLFTEGK